MGKILNYDIFDGCKDEYLNCMLDKYKEGKKIVILSGNPEVLYNGIKNKELDTIYDDSDIIPDGIGVLLAGKMTGQRFKEKIAGIDIMTDILKMSNKHGLKIYLLGAEKDIVEKAYKVCNERYNAIISGYHDGYFDMENCDDIIEDINKNDAKVLFVAMGCPRQEMFIAKYKDVLNCSIFMGVGGSFDVLAGKVNRAPDWMINMGLEWLHRVTKEPWRIKRLTSIPKFLVHAVFYNLSHRENG